MQSAAANRAPPPQYVAAPSVMQFPQTTNLPHPAAQLSQPIGMGLDNQSFQQYLNPNFAPVTGMRPDIREHPAPEVSAWPSRQPVHGMAQIPTVYDMQPRPQATPRAAQVSTEPLL